MNALDRLNRRLIACERCPRLAEYRARVAREKRRAFRDQEYWGRPVPSVGDPEARALLVGLAPGAHGANRTGRMFTGDGSADFLTPALHRAGFANQPTSIRRSDGLKLKDLYIVAACHCAPPDNKPAPSEIATCRPYLVEHLRLLRRVRVIVALGRIAFDGTLAALAEAGVEIPNPRPQFAHGAEYRLGAYTVVASYHPSRQNTQTGRLTEAMFDEIFGRVGVRLGPGR
jgi:uracil-DNA glycosylase family 4